MRSVHATLTALMLVTLAPAWARAPQPGLDYVPGEVLMAPEPVMTMAAARGLADAAGMTVVQPDTLTRVWRLSVPAVESVESAVTRLSAMPGVRFAQPNYIYRIPEYGRTPIVGGAPPAVSARFTPNDPFFPLQWHMHQVRAEQAWDIEQGSTSVIVAVVDTGVAYRDAPGLYAQVEDLAGVHFVAGYDFVANDEFPDDEMGHGTHVTGTIVQATGNGIGVAGLAHGCSLMPVRALDQNGSGTTATVTEAVTWAVQHGADVVNMSIGSAFGGQADLQAMQQAAEAGAVLVAATGNANQGEIDFPASSPYVIAVGSVRYDKTRAPYSNYGPGIDIMGPGGDNDVDQNGDGNPDGVYQNTRYPGQGDSNLERAKYYWVDGTSQATPHVTATAALLVSHGITGTPRWEVVKNTIETTAEDLGTPGYDELYGAGLVRPDLALASIDSGSGFRLGGTVTYGTGGLANVEVSIGSRTTTSDDSGGYVFTGLQAGAYTVTPTLTGYTFSPPSRAVDLAADSLAVDFAAVRSLTHQFTAGLRMVSCPVVPSQAGTTAADIFGQGASSLYAYNTTAATYAAVTAAPESGVGYFLRLSGDSEAHVEGATVSLLPVSADLAVGYNLLGSTRATTDLALTDLAFIEGQSTMSFDQASAAGAVTPYAWAWDDQAESYVLLHPTLTGASHTVSPWGAFFLEALRAVTVQLPVAEASSTSVASRAAAGYALTVRAAADSAPSALAICGHSSSGPIVASAPAVPGGRGRAELRVTALDSGGDAAFSGQDFRVVLTPGGLRPGTRVALSVDGLEALPRDLSAYLTDESTGRTMSLRVQPWTETTVDGGGRAYTLRVAPRAWGLSVSVLDSTSARGVATVSYRLSSPAEVSAEVLNAAGRVVARLDQGVQAPGMRELAWTGLTDLGTRAPAGEYRVLLTARAETGERATATARVAY